MGLIRPCRRRTALMRLLLAVLALAAIGGCSRPAYYAVAPDLGLNAPYRLASGDRVRVIVFGQDNLSNSFSVDGSGAVAIPLIGGVHAQGLTTSELAQAIEARLRQGYVREPRVSVEVEAFRPFFVMGEVNVAGQYPFINGMTVQNAIAVAGGFTPRAVQDSVDITRIVSGSPATFSEPPAFPVRPGDTITVRERFF
jgi:polysaccharide export outer membrane protein